MNLLHFRVVQKIGAGGMGEVWRASDTTLGRDVAIKVLPATVAGDKEKLARFEREAKLLATLNHPHIAAVYGLHEADGIHFLVMELIEGRDLRERIAGGPLPVEEALAIARQLAAALEEAHDSGVIHRDLKPANVMLTEEDVVKVLDFGLAKAVEPPRPPGAEAELSESPTLTSAGSLAGVILGTAAYMSPEQARGKHVDHRADIWAFGCVLYEMLTGRQCFAGETATDTLGAIIHKDVDMGALPDVPRGVLRVLDRCLAKDRRDRLHHIGDARIEIDDSLSGKDRARRLGDDAGRATSGTRRSAWLVTLGAGLAIGLVAGALGAWQFLSPAGAAPLAPAVRFTIWHPGAQESVVSNPVVAPDGNFIVYEAQEEGTTRLFLRELDGAAPRPQPGTEGARAPFVSPDGRWIGFFAGGALKKIAVSGGVPVEVCEASSNPGGAWGADGTIVFSKSWTSGLVAVSADGGAPRVLTTPGAGETGHWAPAFLPGGQQLVYTIFPKEGSLNLASLVLLDLASGETTRLGAGAFAAPVPGGGLLYFRAGVYELAPYDTDKREIAGPPRIVFEEAPAVDPEGSRERFVSVSDTGVVAFVGREDALVSAPRSLHWVSREGALERLPLPPKTYNGPAVSPDGRRVAFAALEHGEYDLWVSGVESASAERLTRESNNHGAEWRPDGRGFAFVSLRLGSFDVFWQEVGAGAAPEPLATGPEDMEPGTFTPDGRAIAIERYSEDAGRDILLLDVATKSMKPIVSGPADEFGAAISPDGRWLAYVSDRTGRLEVFVQALSGGPVTRVSRDGGTDPRWSSGKNELFFVRWPEVHVAPWRMDAERFVAGRPRPFAAGDGARYVREHFVGEYSLGPDPDRVLVTTLDEPLRPRIHVLTGGVR